MFGRKSKEIKQLKSQNEAQQYSIEASMSVPMAASDSYTYDGKEFADWHEVEEYRKAAQFDTNSTFYNPNAHLVQVLIAMNGLLANLVAAFESAPVEEKESEPTPIFDALNVATPTQMEVAYSNHMYEPEPEPTFDQINQKIRSNEFARINHQNPGWSAQDIITFIELRKSYIQDGFTDEIAEEVGQTL